MINNGCLNSNINPNSLAVDKELTRMARDLSKRLKQRMTEVERKAEQLENITNEVSLRVTSAASRMANLKNHKPVQQIISTQNVPKAEDVQRDARSSDIFSPAFLESYKNAIIKCGQTMNRLDNPVVFPTSSTYEGPPAINGYTNGHSANDFKTNGHTDHPKSPEMNGIRYTQSPDIDESPVLNRSRVEEPVKVETVTIPQQPVQQAVTPSPVPTQVNKRNSTYSETSEHSKEADPLESSQKPEALTPDTVSIPAEKSPVSKVPSAMASVIGEIRQKNAAKPKFFDTDSDSDTEPLQPSTSQRPEPKIPTIEKSQLDIVKPPPKLPSLPQKTEVKAPILPPAQPKLPRKSPVSEPKEMRKVANIFDSDSDSDSEFLKPLTKPTGKQTVVAKPSSVPAKKPIEPVLPKVSNEVPKTAPAKVVPASKPPATKPIVGKSLFSSDSDSDDDFLKSFSKPKTVEKHVVPPVSKPTEPKKAEVPKPVIPPVNSTTIIPRNVETKVETKPKKPVSLFDDSDSDSDLFSTKSKPKSLIAPKKDPSPPVVNPVVNPIVNPAITPVEPFSPRKTEPAIPQKGSPSESMSAKISLIAEMQKSFRLPGQPTIPVKETSDEQEIFIQEQVNTIGAMLKSRSRGPSNRRPPTRGK
uniref:WH2 domain-containing protein n=1 Tax=Caenorhabditis tropicalis TaxID=1561998 RepID=A0A1I7TMZ9_9PELO